MRKRGPRPAGDAGTPADRLPPHSPEAEAGLLSCIIQSPESCLPEAIEMLSGRADAFYDLRHQNIFCAMLDMFEQSRQLDLITLQQHLGDNGMLEDCGGFAYVAELPDKAPSPANLAQYAAIIREKALLRRVIQLCQNTTSRLLNHEGEVTEALDDVEREFLKLQDANQSGEEATARDLVQGALASIEEWHKNAGMLPGLSTGLADLDRITCGLKPGELIIFAGRPSVGKSSLAMQIAEHLAVEKGVPVGVFSLEMTGDSLMTRMLCGRARVNLRNLMAGGQLTERDFPRMTAAAAKLSNAPLYIDDCGTLSVMQLRAKARRMAQRRQIKLLVVDYLQLLQGSHRAENRQQEVTQISQGLKALAKELSMPVIAVAQLNREVENRPDGKPRMSDLRESGALEQDGDLIGMLYHKKGDGGDSSESDAQEVGLLIAKQRNGPKGEVDLVFLKPFTRFENAARVEADDIPTVKAPYADD